MSAFYQSLESSYELVFNFYRLELEIPRLRKAAKIAVEVLDQNGQPIKDVRPLYSTKLSTNANLLP
jgi:hypothetical protein